MDDILQENARTLEYLKRKSELWPHSAKENTSPDVKCWKEINAHPEVIERVWGDLAKDIPGDCRAIVHGIPVLRHHASGLIFVICLGTFYWMRVPSELMVELRVNEFNFVKKMSNGKIIDVRKELGDGWVYGRWREEELEWCLVAYNRADENRDYGVMNV